MTDIAERLRYWSEQEGDIFRAQGRAAVIGDAANEIERLREELSLAHSERTRLAADLATAQKDILPWIELASRRWAAIGVLEYALYRIAMPGKDIAYCRDGHEIAVLVARDALKEAGNA